MTQPLFLTECSFIPSLPHTHTFSHSFPVSPTPHSIHPFTRSLSHSPLLLATPHSIQSLSFPQPLHSFIPSFPLLPTPHSIHSFALFPTAPSFIPPSLLSPTPHSIHSFIHSLFYPQLPSPFLSYLPSFPPSLAYLHLQLMCCVLSPTRYKSWPGCCSVEKIPVAEFTLI